MAKRTLPTSEGSKSGERSGTEDFFLLDLRSDEDADCLDCAVDLRLDGFQQHDLFEVGFEQRGLVVHSAESGQSLQGAEGVVGDLGVGVGDPVGELFEDGLVEELLVEVGFHLAGEVRQRDAGEVAEFLVGAVEVEDHLVVEFERVCGGVHLSEEVDLVFFVDLVGKKLPLHFTLKAILS